MRYSEKHTLADIKHQWHKVKVGVPRTLDINTFIEEVHNAIISHNSNGTYQYSNPYSFGGDGTLTLWFELQNDADHLGTFFALKYQ